MGLSSNGNVLHNKQDFGIQRKNIILRHLGTPEFVSDKIPLILLHNEMSAIGWVLHRLKKKKKQINK